MAYTSIDGSVFQIVNDSGTTFYGHDLTTSVGTIRPGLLVIRDAAGDTVSLAAASGSLPLGFAYGERDLTYAPTSKVFASGETIVVAMGHGVAFLTADFFASGSLPSEIAGETELFAAANGLIDWTGTNKIGRTLNQKDITLPTGGTGTTATGILIEYNFAV